MYDYRLEGHLKEAVGTQDVTTLNRILRSNILPESRLVYYFHSAVQSGKIKSVRAFLASRKVHVDHVNVDLGGKGRMTALHEAILNGNCSMVKLLLCAGASLDAEASFHRLQSDALQLARMSEAHKIVSLIGKYKRWICGKLYESVNYLTKTRDYVMLNGGRKVHSDLPETRMELVDELMDFFEIIREHVNILQHHWKLLESVYERKHILCLIEEAFSCIKIIKEYHRFTKVELRIYESRVNSLSF